MLSRCKLGHDLRAWSAQQIFRRANKLAGGLGHNEQLVAAPAVAVHKLLCLVAGGSTRHRGHYCALGAAVLKVKGTARSVIENNKVTRRQQKYGLRVWPDTHNRSTLNNAVCSVSYSASSDDSL